MRKITLFLAAALIFIASCSREIAVNFNIPGPGNSNSIPGNFVITKFANLNSNADSTTAFNGYVFTFGENGKVNAAKDNQVAAGSYTESYVSGDNLELALYFYNKPLSNINGNWWVKSISDNFIDLGNASTGDVLEFSAQ